MSTGETMFAGTCIGVVVGSTAALLLDPEPDVLQLKILLGLTVALVLVLLVAAALYLDRRRKD